MKKRKTFKIEIGKSYETRNGLEVIKIARQSDKDDVNFQKTHAFVDENGCTYMENGRAHPFKEFPFDLVKEVVVKPRRNRN